MIKKLNSKETMNGALTILTGILVLIGSGMITQAMAQQNQSASDNASGTGNDTGSSANMSATSLIRIENYLISQKNLLLSLEDLI